MKNSEKTLDMIVNLCKNRGFIYPGSEIYGGLANSWDYGPLGVEFKNNVKKAWMKKFVQESPYNVGLDAAILMNPQTWVTTGHVSSFSDPLLDCRACKSRHRADKLISECEQGKGVDVDAMTFDEMDEFIATHPEVVCPVCGKHDFTPIRKFNLMFKTAIGVTEDSSSTCYLRPETAQGIFVNFANIQRTTRRKLPFGVCQVGKAFRNEITPGNFTFRTREFEQMECEFFCKPNTDLEWFAYWKDYCKNWLLSLGIKEENLRLRDHEPAELAFYSRATTDIEYAFPFTDWGELWGIADRTNYDLSRHQEASGKSLEYFDPETNEHYIPYVIEPSLGCDRVALAFLCEAYDEQHLVDAKGVEYAGGQHGFARDVEHTMTHHADNLLEFELHANAETLPKWPYAFVLRSTFTLEGETVHHTLTVENPVEDKLCFGIGYHPAFALPFDDRHVTEDYEIRFDGVESPLSVISTPTAGLASTERVSA